MSSNWVLPTNEFLLSFHVRADGCIQIGETKNSKTNTLSVQSTGGSCCRLADLSGHVVRLTLYKTDSTRLARHTALIQPEVHDNSKLHHRNTLDWPTRSTLDWIGLVCSFELKLFLQ